MCQFIEIFFTAAQFVVSLSSAELYPAAKTQLQLADAMPPRLKRNAATAKRKPSSGG